jgi:hypothetical protein
VCRKYHVVVEALPVDLVPLRGKISGVYYITKLPPNFGSLLYSTYYGTPGDESFFAFGIDPVGHAYIAGWPKGSRLTR